MSPPRGSKASAQNACPTPTDRVAQKSRSSAGSRPAAKSGRNFDAHAFLATISEGREATIGILSDGSFFGEGSLVGRALGMGSASALTDCTVVRIEKKAMMEALHRKPEFPDIFVAYLLSRNIRYEEDLVDQLFNSSEMRLARVLLLLAHFGKEGIPQAVVPKSSQETLAEMMGTTRSRLTFFMNRFRELGFIRCNGGLQVNGSPLNVVLHD